MKDGWNTLGGLESVVAGVEPAAIYDHEPNPTGRSPYPEVPTRLETGGGVTRRDESLSVRSPVRPGRCREDLPRVDDPPESQRLGSKTSFQ